MESCRTRYRTTNIRDILEPIRYPSSGFDPEPSTIAETFAKNAKVFGHYPSIVSKEGVTYTYNEYYETAELFSKAILSFGLELSDVVCMIGFTSPEYLFSLQGSWLVGCVTAGIYTTNSAAACQYVLEHSEAKICLCQGGANAAKIASLREGLPNLKAIVVYWPEDGVPSVDSSDGLAQVYSWDDFLQVGKHITEEEVRSRMEAVRPGNCASLIYTSGTTGNPKGVMISHDNAMFIAQTCKTPFLLNDNDRLVSYLPMNHIAAQFLDAIVPTFNRTTVYMARPDALQKSLSDTMRLARPTFFLAVPRVWEKIGDGINQSFLSLSWCKRKWVQWCQKIGAKTCSKRLAGQKLHLSCLYKLADKTCFAPIRKQYGLDQARMMIACAAPVAEETVRFFSSFDIPILDLYGQSEGTGPVTTNTHLNQAWKLNTAGRCLPGIQSRIDPCTSELLYRGRNNMMGYLKMPAETAATIDEEGWIHTGDQAKMDADGYISITGRLKELIVTAGGENISPVPIENKILELCPMLANCVVIGDKRRFLSCILTLKTVFNPLTGEPTGKLTPACIEYLHVNGIEATTVSQAKEHPHLQDIIESAINSYNQTAISRAQNIRKWIVLDKDLSLSAGELTATLKLRRNVVHENYKDSINALYN